MSSASSVKYSFIIPVKAINDYIRESIPKILEIGRADFEVIIYPDETTEEKWGKTRQIRTGRVGPAAKRCLAFRDALGDFLIFIDDDAYPEKNILEILDKDFRDEGVAVVGGPAITPKSDSFLQKVSGAVFLSSLSGGFPERYVPIGKRRYVSDWPSVNLTVRKNIFLKIGGFDTNYWPGEDTIFCLDIMSNIKERTKILYDPEVLVWHHRRKGLLRHLKQIGGYGIHRGFFAKKFPETSFKFKYFVPGSFFLFITFGILPSLYNRIALELYITGWLFYLLAMIKVFFEIYKYEKSLAVSAYSLVYIFFTHVWYGIRFIQGFIFTRDLKSKFQ